MIEAILALAGQQPRVIAPEPAVEWVRTHERAPEGGGLVRVDGGVTS